MYACILPGLFYIKTVNVELTRRNTFKKALDLTRDLLPMTTRSLKKSRHATGSVIGPMLNWKLHFNVLAKF